MNTPFEIQLILFATFTLLTGIFYIAVSRLSRDYENIKQQPWFVENKSLSPTHILFKSRKNRHLLSFVIGLVGFFLGMRILGGLSGAFIGAFICYLLPQVAIKQASWRHRQKLEKQLAYVLHGISGLILSGKTTFEALKQASLTAPLDVRQELGVVVRQVEQGIALEDALGAWDMRIQRPHTNAAIRVLCGAIKAHGDLAIAFKRAANLVLENTKLELEKYVLLVQLRVRALLLGGIPLVFLSGVYIVQPSFLTPLLNTSMGYIALWVVGVFQLLTYRVIVTRNLL